MNKSKEAAESALPSYEHEHGHGHGHEGVPSYEEAPSYETSTGAAVRQAAPSVANLTLDPTGLFIKPLHPSDAPPVYTLTSSLLHVHSTSSVHVKRVQPDGEELTVYAIGEHFISPLLSPRNKELRHVTAARSHGFLVSINLREIVWDFSTRVPAPKVEGKDVVVNPANYPVDPVYMIGTGPGPGTVEKHLLQLHRGKWVDDDDELVAIEREAGPECEGMPVLSVMKELDEEMMDFLISAWCVTMWEDIGKRARRLSKSSAKANAGKVK